MSTRLFRTFVWLGLASTIPLQAQPTLVIRGGELCRTCRVVASELFRLPSDHEAMRDGGFEAMRLSGAGIIGFSVRPGPPRVLGMNGRVTGILGRVGGGPGEFRHPFALGIATVPNDSVYIFDRGNRRLSVFAPGGDFVRSHAMPLAVREFIVHGDTYIVNGDFRTPEAAGYPLHILRKGDSAVRSFGSNEPMSRPSDPLRNLRILVPGKGGRFLAIRRTHEYAVEEWSMAGSLTSRWQRDVSWFPVMDRLPRRSLDHPPPPLVTGAWLGEDGLLWVVLLVARRDWRRAYASEESIAEGGERVRQIERPELLYETLVEVLDLAESALVASGRFPDQYRLLVGPGLVASADIEGRTDVVHKVVRLALERR